MLVLQCIIRLTNQLNGSKDYSFMMTPRYINILFYIFIKWIVTYIIFMFLTSNYSMIQMNNLRTIEDIFYYLWLVLFMPVMSMLIFSLPYFLSFKASNSFVFLSSITIIIVIEYLHYVYFNSQKLYDKNGIIFILIGSLIFYFLFSKSIRKQIR